MKKVSKIAEKKRIQSY